MSQKSRERGMGKMMMTMPLKEGEYKILCLSRHDEYDHWRDHHYGFVVRFISPRPAASFHATSQRSSQSLAWPFLFSASRPDRVLEIGLKWELWDIRPGRLWELRCTFSIQEGSSRNLHLGRGRFLDSCCQLARRCGFSLASIKATEHTHTHRHTKKKLKRANVAAVALLASPSICSRTRGIPSESQEAASPVVFPGVARVVRGEPRDNPTGSLPTLALLEGVPPGNQGGVLLSNFYYHTRPEVGLHIPREKAIGIQISDCERYTAIRVRSGMFPDLFFLRHLRLRHTTRLFSRGRRRRGQKEKAGFAL